ncbi:P22AR C-terminal domain [Klebsiella pneumoniae]|uniref:P22AR C-terminal domain-containing protein n=1 Tax=Klebsiella pneumoniae TaxID=573 RepID=UPI000E2DBC6F|nr:P22AR C-terminal domain-containing protein [Klebsiella pneumoniae]SXP06016.1 P22AR C-terminal domain [Klebsiella pneumoniae]
MVSKNSEAPLAATFGASIENNREGNIDMNIVAKSDFNFHGVTLNPVENVTGVWLTSADIAKALGYKSTKSISNLFAQYEDEFSQGMTMVIESVTNGINGSTRRMKVRVFSLRGAHLIAMFARTPVAKEFRRWVLDILDREVAHSPIAKQFSDEELCSLSYLWRSSAVMYEACHNIYPLLLAAEHKLLPRFASIVTNHARTINRTRDLLRRETKHIEQHPWGDTNWKNVFSYGTGVLQ